MRRTRNVSLHGRSVRVRTTALAVVALGLLAGGCGGGGANDNAANGGQPADKSTKTPHHGSKPQGDAGGKTAGRCRVNSLRDLTNEATLRDVPKGRYASLPFPLQKTKLGVRPLAVTTTHRAPSLPDHPGGHLKSQGGVFLVVRFQVRNTGHAATPVASTVLDRMVVIGKGGKVYGRADANGKCKGVGSAFAAHFHVLSPLGLLKPGKAAESVAVYVVPAFPKNAGWAARQQFAVFSLPHPQ